MSIQYSDTTNNKGIVQLYEREVYGDGGIGRVSNDTTKLKNLTADVNIAFDEFLQIAIPASGTWQFDDTNHSDFPEITTNLFASQRDYTFTTDEGGNLILDIYRVFTRTSTSDPYVEIYPVDVQSGTEFATTRISDGLNTEGTPYLYEKMANGILLDPIPDTSVTNGLKVYINRESSYFTTTDTTKKPGVPGILHSWFYKKPALEYAKRNGLANVNRLQKDVDDLRDEITKYFSRREKDVRHRVKPKRQLYK